MDELDELERAAKEERVARDEWLAEIRRQFADDAAGLPIDDKRRHALYLAWNAAHQRLAAIRPKDRP